MTGPTITLIGEECEELVAMADQLNRVGLTTYLLPAWCGTPMATAIARPDLVVIDTRKAETAAHILDAFQSEPRTARIPAIVCLGAEDPARCGALARYRVNTVLVKPFTPDELVGRIGDLLGREWMASRAGPEGRGRGSIAQPESGRPPSS